LHRIYQISRVRGGGKSPLFVTMIDKKKVEELVNSRISELDNGLFVVDVSVSSNSVITVELDKWNGGVSVEDCLSVSRNVEHNLDRETNDFELTVSSAGLDRPLRVKAQYEKNIGRLIDVTLKDGTKYSGILKTTYPEGIDVDIVKKVSKTKKNEQITETIRMNYDTIKEAKLVISIK